MDCRARRSRRGRPCYSSCTPPPCQPWSFVDSFSSFIILSCLLGLIYLMLEYHCNTSCNSSCDLKNINNSIADIAKNVAGIKQRYQELELKISRFSQEIPKLEGQFELIEALTCAIEKKESGWDPRINLPLPNVDVFLNNPCELGKNVSCNYCPKPVPKFSAKSRHQD